MKQLTFALNSDFTAHDMNKQVAEHPAFKEASSRVQLIFEPESSVELIQSLMDEHRDELPNTITIGMTTLGVENSSIHVPQDPVHTFLLFKNSEVHLHVYDCHDMEPAEAGFDLAEEVSRYSNVRGVMCISSCARMCPASFLEKFAYTHPDVPVFGTQAGTKNVANDQSVFFVDDGVYDKGIAALVFCGEDLHLHTDYNLGWRPIGKTFTVTGYEGSGTVSTIDDNPAAMIYRRYLNVVPDEHFFSNVCAFPLLMQSGRRMVARVPMHSTYDGMLQFTMTVDKGERTRFSYTKPTYLLQGSLSAANEMARFDPQGMLVFACLNRRVFLGDADADRELDYYKQACDDMAWVYGYGEILRTTEGGGILNSSIVAVAMREGEASGEEPQAIEDPALIADSAVIPLPERLIAFLEATTLELNDTIDELETLAERDQLTGVYNRRRMDELIRYELSKRRTHDDLVLLMYDIDFFKRVNDTYGHDIGDIVLKDLTKTVHDVIRAADTLGRWGGEEFLCLLTGTTLSDARMVAERIRRRVEQTEFLHVGKVTISIGITSAQLNDTPETLFTRVDKALYDAKHAGRNCVCMR